MKYKITIFLMVSLLGFSACEINHLWDKDYMFEYIQPQDGVLVYNCSNYKLWHFFSFAQDSVIGSCDAMNDAEMEIWKNRRDWDIAFHRQNIKTNGGISGVGLAGIQVYEQNNFDFDAVKIAPEDGYVNDVQDSIVYDLTNMMNGVVPYAHTGVNPVTKGWAVLTDMQSGTWTYVRKVFIVRTADGKFAKIYLKNFKGSNGASGTVTMQYVYQSDGTVNLEVESHS